MADRFRMYGKKAGVGLLLIVIGMGLGLVLRAPEADVHEAAHTDAGPGEKATVWTCSMHPQIRLPEPGQCPICFMDLIPLVTSHGAGQAKSLRQLPLSEDAARLAGVRTAPVRLAGVSASTRLFGNVAYDESRISAITAWTGGRIDKLHVDTTGAVIRPGQAMAWIYSPELVAAQAELLSAVRAEERTGSSTSRLVIDSARRMRQAAMDKLRLLGMGRGQIQAVIDRGAPLDHVTVTAPSGGIVTERKVTEGAYVQTGTPLYALADLSRVWVELAAYESDLNWIATGRNVDFVVEALPGEHFSGTVRYVDTVVDPVTRTVEVRLDVPNPRLLLKPGMFVRAVQQDGRVTGDRQLVIPASAPLLTGERAVVYVADAKRPGVYEGREVILGPKTDQGYVVRRGLKEGELVVVQGSFRIDAALQIVASPSMMSPDAGSTAAGGAVRFPDVDQPFTVRLAGLARKVGAVQTALAGGDIAAVHEAYHAFAADLNTVDAFALNGEPELVWKELAMLLGNDALLGYEAQDLHRATMLTHELDSHFDRIRAAFPLPDLSATVQSGPELRSALEKLYTVYRPLQAALAGDNPDKARSALGVLQETLELADAAARPPIEDPDAWAAHKAPIAGGLEAMQTATDLVGLRTGFYPLSQAMSKLVADYGVGGGPVYELFCPMAFGNTGATWLQSDPKISNPYFGASMLRCGEVRRQLRDE